MSPFADTNDMRLLLGSLSQIKPSARVHDEAYFVVGIGIGVRVIISVSCTHGYLILRRYIIVDSVCSQRTDKGQYDASA